MYTTVETTKPNVVNGINVDDLMALRARVEQDASKGKTNWRVITTWQGQTRSRADVSGFGIGGEEVPRRFSFDIDEPCELGGSNAFANPQEYLIAALNACMTVGYVAQCAIRGITLKQLLDKRIEQMACNRRFPPGGPLTKNVSDGRCAILRAACASASDTSQNGADTRPPPQPLGG
jgi:hypothetical protein